MNGKHIKRHILILAMAAAAALTVSFGMLAVGCTENGVVTPSDVSSADVGGQDAAAKPDPDSLPASKLKITLSHESGVYGRSFTLDCTLGGEGQLFYTLDGSDPRVSESRIAYDGGIPIVDRSGDPNVLAAIPTELFDSAVLRLNSDGTGWETLSWPPSDNDVDKCNVVKITALDKSGLYCPVVSGTYFVRSMAHHIPGLAESCAASGKPLAVISISMEADDLFDHERGIYVRGKLFDDSLARLLEEGVKLEDNPRIQVDANYKARGREWERPAHIDFFECLPDGSECVLSQNCGIRIQGNYSRSDLQKGFRLYARKDYGEKNFKYPVFGEELKDDAGEVMDKFSTLVLRNGGNCAFTTKYSDTYWQSLVGEYAVETQTSRPCVVYLNGEYWGIYVLQEDYTNDYFEDTHGVDKSDVVVYKGDAETYAIGYKLDEGDLPAGASEDYYFADLNAFFKRHSSCASQEDYDELTRLVDPDSVRDYFAIQMWINNKWDWPGKNWSMWRTTKTDKSNPYADCRWRYCLYDVEFGGISGRSDAGVNTIREDNYMTYGMLDRRTGNPAVLAFAYLMTNKGFREDFYDTILGLSQTALEQSRALERLDLFKNTYSPLYDQFFARFGYGSSHNAVYGGYASYACIRDFLSTRAGHIQTMLDWAEEYYTAVGL